MFTFGRVFNTNLGISIIGVCNCEDVWRTYSVHFLDTWAFKTVVLITFGVRLTAGLGWGLGGGIKT